MAFSYGNFLKQLKVLAESCCPDLGDQIQNHEVVEIEKLGSNYLF